MKVKLKKVQKLPVPVVAEQAIKKAITSININFERMRESAENHKSSSGSSR